MYSSMEFVISLVNRSVACLFDRRWYFYHKNVENVTAAMSISLETIAFIQTNIRRCCFSNVNYFDIMRTRN